MRLRLRLIVLLLCSLQLQAALSFTNSTDKLSCGTGSSLDSLATRTVIAWVYHTSAVNGRVWQKGLTTASHLLEYGGVGTTVNANVARATTTCTVSATCTNFAVYGLDKWIFVAATNDTGTAGNNKIFMGDLVTHAAEPSGYSSQSAGSGGVTSNAGAASVIGNKSNDSAAFGGRIALVGIWNRVLTAGEIKVQQFRPRATSGCVYFSILGYAGTGTHGDLSGNGHTGTVTGAAVAAHVPIVAPYSFLRGAFFAFFNPGRVHLAF